MIPHMIPNNYCNELDPVQKDIIIKNAKKPKTGSFKRNSLERVTKFNKRNVLIGCSKLAAGVIAPIAASAGIVAFNKYVIKNPELTVPFLTITGVFLGSTSMLYFTKMKDLVDKVIYNRSNLKCHKMELLRHNKKYV